MFDKFTERANYTLRHAEEESRKLGHDYVGTGMILLGVLGEGGKVSRMLDGFGVTLDTAREELLALIGRGDGHVHAEIPYTDNAKHALEVAFEESQKRAIKNVSVSHILYSLLQGKDTMAIRVFDVMGVNIEIVSKQISEELDKDYGVRTS